MLCYIFLSWGTRKDLPQHQTNRYFWLAAWALALSGSVSGFPVNNGGKRPQSLHCMKKAQGLK